MKYEYLTDEMKTQTRVNTITAIETEHYANTLALARAEASGQAESIAAIKAQIESLEAQHTALVEN